ncbi:Hypothetical predicted protein [Mytilus galloprovincialis]|uniref:HD domain-containing protein n=2 Tax=Mytilus galloprovincialis TaxID=29158 RepID=A0A8B6EH18_MYTGA|nr:Hypothetical predicted protein [Mytilus galloprovincialis]
MNIRDMTDLKQCWMTLSHDRLGVSEEKTLNWWKHIQSQYSESHRYYHTLNHLIEMFDHLNGHKTKLSDPDLVSLAIFFHDIIYDPMKSDNEERSAELFVQYTTECSVNLKEEEISKVKDWILLTKTHQVNDEGSEDYHYFLDIDMAVLGRQDKGYKEYADQIREEYKHVPEKEYKTKRSKVLVKIRVGN